VNATEKKAGDPRIKALRRFAVAITTLNVFGHLVLGFEMSYAHPLVAMATAYTLEVGLGWLDARAKGRPPAFLGGGLKGFVDYLLPAHITALACAMLLYTNGTFMPLVFGVAIGVCFKYLFRAPVRKGKTSHFFNPSNTGIALTLIAFPWVSVAPPYMFTANVDGVWNWIIPGVVVVTGTLLNSKLTKKMPLLTAWVVVFLLQAVLRGAFTDASLLHALSPMTGLAFVLFTFYMVTDPGTTPFKPRNQVAFGSAVAIVYAVLMMLDVVYTIFFALILVCAARGIFLHALAWYRAREERLAEAVETLARDLQPAGAGSTEPSGVRQ
jgi:enediyne biosynthesis protein E5